MDKRTEIKQKLDVIYKDYKNNKSYLNDKKTEMAARLIVEMTFSKNVNPSDVAAELARFSAEVAKIYFDSLTKSVNIPLGVLDEVLKEWHATYKDSKQSQHYVQKYVSAVTAIIKNYKDKSSKSTQLPRLVAFIAQFAVKSDKYRSRFQALINNTMAGIFILDYSNINKNALVNIWNATKAIYPDLSKAKYESFITEWAVKYGFITSTAPEKPTSTDNKVKIEESVVIKETATEGTPAAVQPPVKTKSVNPASKKEEPKVPVTNDAASEKRKKLTAVSVLVKNDTPAEKPIAVSETKKANAPAEKPIAVSETKKANTPAEKPIAVSETKKANAPAEKPIAVSETKKANAPAEKPIAVPETKKTNVPAEEPVVNTDKKVSNNIPGENVPVKKNPVQILYERLKRDMDKEQEAIITAFTNMITPVGKAFESIQGEINKSRELGIENTILKAKNEELERQIAEMKTKLQENNQSFSSAKAENSDLRQQVRSLETKIAELDSKLNDAYSINSREASLEAEKVRSELKKAFSFLYEDWLEYEFSDVSEENYESLQAIMKKIFRSLERNGIDFKGSNE